MKKMGLSINTIVGEDTVVHGGINLNGNIIVYGKVFGDIKTDGAIRVAACAKIDGSLSGQNIHISGNVEGNINGLGKVILGNKANLLGDIKASQIVIEEGARFVGKCYMQTDVEEKGSKELFPVNEISKK